MPVAELGGIEIAYELVGAGQPWVITPGGRFTKDVGGLPEMARALAKVGIHGGYDSQRGLLGFDAAGSFVHSSPALPHEVACEDM